MCVFVLMLPRHFIIIEQNEARGTPPRLFMTVGDGIHRKAQLVSSERYIFAYFLKSFP